jgi:hypothetical protein
MAPAQRMTSRFARTRRGGLWMRLDSSSKMTPTARTPFSECSHVMEVTIVLGHSFRFAARALTMRVGRKQSNVERRRPFSSRVDSVRMHPTAGTWGPFMVSLIGRPSAALAGIELE